jgi:hypothetical protein
MRIQQITLAASRRCCTTQIRNSSTSAMPAFRNDPLKPSGYYMYHQFNIQQFYVLPTQYIYVFCVDLRIKSDYFPMQH